VAGAAGCLSVASFVVPRLAARVAWAEIFGAILVPAVVIGVFGLFAVHGRGEMRLAGMWRAAPSRRRQFVIGSLAVLIASFVLGGGSGADIPGVRDGRFVALEHGGVVRVLNKEDYADLRRKQLRSVLAIGGTFATLLALAWSLPPAGRAGTLQPQRDSRPKSTGF
jgi:hypothetical protein